MELQQLFFRSSLIAKKGSTIQLFVLYMPNVYPMLRTTLNIKSNIQDTELLVRTCASRRQ